MSVCDSMSVPSPQAGVSVNSDLTNVFNSYGVRGTQAVDVGQMAGRHLDVMVGARSLQALTATLLKRQLSKGSVRTSDWETTLTQEQVSSAEAGELCWCHSPHGGRCSRFCPLFFFMFVEMRTGFFFLCSRTFCILSSVMVQVTYAGLDAYAGVLLFDYVYHRMDPVFTEPRPDVESLPADTTLRLYTATNSRCVAEGTLEEYGNRTWGRTELIVGRREAGTPRVVVRLTKKHIPGALALHPGEGGGEPQALDQLELGDHVLWDAVSEVCFLKTKKTYKTFWAQFFRSATFVFEMHGLLKGRSMATKFPP